MKKHRGVYLLLFLVLAGTVFAMLETKDEYHEIPWRDAGFFFTDTTQKTLLSCPAADKKALTFLVLGQSQAANTNNTVFASDGNKELLNAWNGKCYRLEDPVLGASDEGGSLWTVFAQKLYARLHRPVVILNYAANGSDAKLWRPDRGDNLMTRLINDANKYTAQGGKIDYIIYDQGEADAMYETPKQDYKNDLEAIFDYVQKAFDGEQKILLFQTSLCPPYTGKSKDILDAQAEVAAARKDTQIVFNTDTLDRSYRHDGCHFNARGAQVVTDHLVGAVLKTQTE